MALSRIWAAFIIIAITVAGYKCFFAGDNKIFTRMVTGKADDAYTSVYYVAVGETDQASTRQEFLTHIGNYGYLPADSAHPAGIIISNNTAADSVRILQAMYPGAEVRSYEEVRSKLPRHVDGIIETCLVAVNLCIKLIGIMALFMGLMAIA
ncbi:MAG TPA: hypothetical protein VEB40_05855, partial [Flavipsychrobacter sp.]|nr:hypothetical protein [Flavipsychrobacter sp.]